MNLNLFLVIAIVCNTLLSVIFPTYLYGNANDGILGDSKVKTAFSDTNSNLQGYDSTTGEVISNYDGSDFKDVIEAPNTAPATSTTGFDIFDPLKVVFSIPIIGDILSWIFATSIILFNMAYPIGFMLGSIYTTLYIYAIVRFIRGA